MTMPLLFFFASGACALVYQVVWVRRLLLIVGTTTGAVSTVLAVFMAGLGLGAWLFGSAADRSRAPLRLYAFLELGIGLYALLLPGLIAVSTPAYVGVARHLTDEPALLLLVRVVLGFLLLLVPTVLMGGTLPVLVRYVGRSLDRFGAALGILYGANLAGGVAGSLAAGFVLIPALGVQAASLAAVTANLAVGVAALAVAARARSAAAGDSRESLPGRADPAAPAAAPAAIPDAARPLVWTAVFLSGLLSMAFEVLWSRILVFSLGSTVYAFTLILATFLTGLALGSRLAVATGRRHHPLLVLGVALVAAGIAAMVMAPISTRSEAVIVALSSRFGWTGDVFLAATALCAALVVLMPATLMGLVLPLGMQLLVDDLAWAGRRVGSAYLANTVGCVLGSLLAGFALIPLLGLTRALLVLAGVQVALGCAFLLRAEVARERRRPLLALSGALVIAGVVVASALLRGPNPFDPALAASGNGAPVVEAHRDAIGSSVSVVTYPGGDRTLRIDGFEASSNKAEAAYMPMMTHIPMLLHPDPRRLLVVCFGTGATAGAGLLYPGVSIDVVDINRTVFDVAPYFAATNHGVARDPRARLVVDDGRNFLLTARQRYDVITSEPMPPHQAGVVNLYSREYYLLARERLERGGLIVQWLPIHLLTVDESLRILKTVQDVFPETTLWLHGHTGIIVARRDVPIQIDLARVAVAFAPGPLRADLGRLGLETPLDFALLAVMGPDEIRAATSTVRPVTDDHPSLEFHRFRHPLQEYRGPFNLEQARMMSIIYRQPTDQVVPVAGATAAQVAALAAWRKMENQRGLADVERWGLGG
jgi:predicted membrane-bound spermidine synthase